MHLVKMGENTKRSMAAAAAAAAGIGNGNGNGNSNTDNSKGYRNGGEGNKKKKLGGDKSYKSLYKNHEKIVR